MGVPAEISQFCTVSFPPLPMYQDNNFTMLSKNLSQKDFLQLVEHTANTDLTTHSPLTNYQVHHHPNYSRKIEMVYWILAAIVFIYVREFVEKNILQPLGRQLGVKDKHSRRMTHLLLPRGTDSTASLLKLEKAYIASVRNSSSSSSLNHEQVKILSNDTGLESRVIERWLRRRIAADKPSDLVKFMESGWRFVWYISSTTFGLIVLWDKPWLWDITQCWKDYSNHAISNGIWWYYLLSAGQYISLLITLTSDVKRKDYREMCAHHCITISLLAISWSYNLTRWGSYVLVLHDVSDILLEATKMSGYCKRHHLANGIFLIFTLVWVVTRLVLFPHQAIYKCVESQYPTGLLSQVHMVVLLVQLLMLFGLHIFWTYFIAKIAHSSISSPANFKDARSSSEEEQEARETETQETIKLSRPPNRLT